MRNSDRPNLNYQRSGESQRRADVARNFTQRERSDRSRLEAQTDRARRESIAQRDRQTDVRRDDVRRDLDRNLDRDRRDLDTAARNRDFDRRDLDNRNRDFDRTRRDLAEGRARDRARDLELNRRNIDRDIDRDRWARDWNRDVRDRDRWDRDLNRWAWRGFHRGGWPGYAHYHPWHRGWHRGYWGYWGNNWYPWVWFGSRGILGRWGWPGYGYSYFNPYYSAPYNNSSVYYYDYSQPIQAPPEDPNEANERLANEYFDAARAAFKQGDYEQALAQVNEAIERLPSDAALHEFRALTLFATGDYKDAAAGVHAVLAAGPGWDWNTLAGLYGNVDEYTAQLRALEAYRKQNPGATDARFLLAYHYLVTGYPDRAAVELKQVTQQKPDDKVAGALLQAIEQRGQPPEEAPAPSTTY